MQNAPVELDEGATLRFAASSRDYILRKHGGAERAVAEQSEAHLANEGPREGSLKRQGLAPPNATDKSQVITLRQRPRD